MDDVFTFKSYNVVEFKVIDLVNFYSGLQHCLIH